MVKLPSEDESEGALEVEEAKVLNEKQLPMYLWGGVGLDEMELLKKRDCKESV
jgi:hypothetical protein